MKKVVLCLMRIKRVEEVFGQFAGDREMIIEKVLFFCFLFFVFYFYSCFYFHFFVSIERYFFCFVFCFFIDHNCLVPKFHRTQPTPLC